MEFQDLGEEFMALTLDVWKFKPESAKKVGHPAPFPVELPRRCIELYTYKGDVVLDPFMGSGSTAIAAIQAGRKFFGYEMDIDYLEASVHRVRKECGNVDLDLKVATGYEAPPKPSEKSDSGK